MTKDELIKNHTPGLTELDMVADKIKDARERVLNANGFGIQVVFYPHESLDVEAALRAAALLPQGRGSDV